MYGLLDATFPFRDEEQIKNKTLAEKNDYSKAITFTIE